MNPLTTNKLSKLTTTVWILLSLLVSSCCSITRIFNPNAPNCQPPVAAFIASETSIQVGETLTFTDQSTGNNIVSHSWVFDNGSPSTWNSPNPPQVTYNAPGVFEVTLTVMNSNGSNTETKSGYITVLEKLNADFSANPRTIRAGNSITFVDNSQGGNINSWQWEFQQGTPQRWSGKTPPQIVYNQPGRHKVSLNIKNSLNDQDKEEKIGFIEVQSGTESITFQPSSLNRKCPTHTSGDRDFNGHGPNVEAWAALRIQGNSIFVDYYLKARETRSDWTTAEKRWSDLLWTAPARTSIVRIESATRSETSYRDTNHQLDEPSIRGGGLVRKFQIMGDTGGGDVNNCTTDDVYMNIIFNPVRVLIEHN